MGRYRLLLAATLIAWCGAAGADQVQLDFASFGLTSWDESAATPHYVVASDTPAMLGYHATRTTGVGMVNGQAATYDLTDTLFKLSVDQRRGGIYGQSFVLSSGEIDFTPLVNVDFQIAGNYSFSSPFAAISVLVQDLTPGGASFSESQWIHNDFSTAPGLMTLGQPAPEFGGGDPAKLMGEFFAGRQYRINYGFQFDTFPDPDDGGTAHGQLAFSFSTAPDQPGPPAPAPLPSTLAMGAAILAALAVLNRFRAARALKVVAALWQRRRV